MIDILLSWQFAVNIVGQDADISPNTCKTTLPTADWLRVTASPPGGDFQDVIVTHVSLPHLLNIPADKSVSATCYRVVVVTIIRFPNVGGIVPYLSVRGFVGSLWRLR